MVVMSDQGGDLPTNLKTKMQFPAPKPSAISRTHRRD
jgi:hypothetical protein